MEQPESPRWPVGGGEMGDLIRAHDWSTTSLGPLAAWPQSLKSTINILLRLPVPAILLWDPDGTVLYNDAYLVFAGKEHPQLLGSKAGEFSSAPVKVASKLLRASAGAAPRRDRAMEFRLHRDGQQEPVWRNVDYSPLFDEAGNAAGILVIILETIEDAAGARELRESEEKFRALAEASPALIAMVDPDANIVYMNQRHVDLYGESWSRIMGTGWHAIVHPDDAPGFIPALEQALRARARFRQRLRVKSQHDEWRWVETCGMPWYGSAQQYAGHVFVTLDITEAVRAEEVLKDAGKSKDEFLATLAHELINPLAPICNLLPLMGRPGGARAADRLLVVLQRQVQQLVRLVDDLIDVSRVTRGKIALRKQPMQLADVVRTAIEESQPLLDSAGHQLTVSLPEAPLFLDADPVRLTQVFANLINNASRYTQDGGHVWLTVYRDKNNALVAVRDNGIGIEGAMLPKVFEMFAQETHSSGGSQRGLGIGLTLVDKLVRMHGGSVEARSEGLGQGSEFIVHLPLASDAQTGLGLDAAAPSRALPQRRVLVVDDNRDAADSLAMLLEFLGAVTQVVTSGSAALAALDPFRPDTVLMDIGMPGIDGFEVAQRIRQQPRFNDIKLIAVTGWGQEGDRRDAGASGFDHYFTKPVDIKELKDLLIDK